MLSLLFGSLKMEAATRSEHARSLPFRQAPASARRRRRLEQPPPPTTTSLCPRRPCAADAGCGRPSPGCSRGRTHQLCDVAAQETRALETCPMAEKKHCAETCPLADSERRLRSEASVSIVVSGVARLLLPPVRTQNASAIQVAFRCRCRRRKAITRWFASSFWVNAHRGREAPHSSESRRVGPHCKRWPFGWAKLKWAPHSRTAGLGA